MFDKFCEKINAELEEFEGQLRAGDVNTAVDSAYELVMKQELACLLTGSPVYFEMWSVADQGRALGIPCILDWFYQFWLKADFSIQDALAEFIEFTLERKPLPEPTTTIFS